MTDGIWLEVSRVRIEQEGVEVQVVGDKNDDKPEWWPVEVYAIGGTKPGYPIYNAIAKGLDSAEQIVIGRLVCKAAAEAKQKKAAEPEAAAPEGEAAEAGPPGEREHDLICESIRIQTK